MPKAKERRTYWWVWLLFGATGSFLVLNRSFFVSFEKPFIDLLNSNFSIAFWGTVGGSATVFLLEWGAKQRKFLSDINTCIGMLTGLSNTLLNMKKQFILPMILSYQSNVNEFQVAETVRKYAGNPQAIVSINLPMNLQHFFCPSMHFDLPTDRVFSMTDRFPQVVLLISQARHSVGDVEGMFRAWNDLVEEIKKLDESERVPFYFGRASGPGKVDTRFPDTVYGLSKAIDESLFFINRSINALTKGGQKTLPFWLKGKIVRNEILKEYKSLMPPDNYRDGWDED